MLDVQRINDSAPSADNIIQMLLGLTRNFSPGRWVPIAEIELQERPSGIFRAQAVLCCFLHRAFARGHLIRLLVFARSDGVIRLGQRILGNRILSVSNRYGVGSVLRCYKIEESIRPCTTPSLVVIFFRREMLEPQARHDDNGFRKIIRGVLWNIPGSELSV